jgi:hypothetical protein
MLNWRNDDTSADVQLLIQWEGLFPEDATWELYDDIKTAYPHFHLEDKLFFQ